jgi:hypothetical protein
MSLQVTVEKGKEGSVLVIRMPIRKEPKASASGKNIVIASTGGNVVTGAQYDGKDVKLGLNAYVSAGAE